MRKVIDLTLGVPTYNSAAHIDELFASITRQTVVPQCLIFCDNRSDDDTVARIERFRVENPDLYIRCYLNEANLGVAGNYNRIIDRAFDTNWLQILDSDDHFVGDYYAQVEPVISSNVDVLLTAMRTRDPAVNAVTRLFEAAMRLSGARAMPEFAQVLGTACARSSVIYRTARVKSERFIDPFFDGSDIIHLNLLMKRNVYWPKAQVFYRIHAASETGQLERSRARAREDRARYLTFVRTLPPGKRLFYEADFTLRKRIGSLIRRR